MTIRFPVASRNAGLDTQLDRADAGAGPATIKVYTGAQPADGDTAESGTLLVTFTCADPAWGAAASGIKTLDADPDLSATAVATGTAGWARMEDSTGANVVDGSVTATGGGGDFTVVSTSITTGQTVNLLTGTITDPA